MRKFAVLAAVLMAAAWSGGAAAAPRASSPEVQARLQILESETHCYVFPGPDEGETRPVCVWRPKAAPDKPLPVLYMADGMIGLSIAVVDLKAALDEGKVAPMMVVATNAKPKPEDRAAEYLEEYSAHFFKLHEDWLVQKVLPWAEKTQRASTERAHRFIGGFSNGADLALSLANKHPDVFGGALVHSPVASNAAWVGEQAATQRWVVTGGTAELSGSIRRGAELPRSIIRSLQRRGAPVRACIGRWDHEGRNWRQLSPGSVTWLLELGDVPANQSPMESSNCRNSPDS